MSFAPQDNFINQENILKVTVHHCDNVKTNILLLQPVVCMHVVDSKTGTYKKKSDRNRAVVSFYENQRNDVDYVIPVMTQPCTISGEKLNVLKWEEAFILNEKYDEFVCRESSVILFFEIADLIPISQTKHQYERLNQNGMRKIAWAFLKILGCNDVVNIGAKLRLQLFKPGKQVKLKKSSHIEVHKWWLSKSRIPLESSLYISLEPHVTFTAEPALRSMLPIQQEKGSTSFEKLSAYDKESLTMSEKSKGSSDERQEIEVVWSRKKGESCKIPLKKELLLDTVNSCQIIKFSSNGRLLAAGCGAHDCYYLMVYQIPQGKLVYKILAHSELIYDLDWSLDDKHILSASGDYSVKMWNSKSCTLVGTFVHPSFVYCARFLPTCDSIFASTCYDHIIRIWRLEKTQLLKELEAHNSTVCALCWNGSGTKLYSADGIGQIKVWGKSRAARKENYQLEREINPKETKGTSINKMMLDLQEDYLYLFCSDSVARVLSLAGGSISSSFEPDAPAPKLSKGCCSPCGNLLFLCSDRGNISVWNISSCDPINMNQVYNLNYGSPSCVEYHPYEHMLALSFWDEGVPIHVFTHERTEEEICKDATNTEDFCMPKSEKQAYYINKISSVDGKNRKLEKKEDGKEIKPQTQSIKGTHIDVSASISKKRHGAAKYQASKLEETSLFGSSDLYASNLQESSSKESLTAVITKSGQFDVIAVTDNSNSFSNIGALGNGDSAIYNRSSKRSQRRKKLRDINKSLL